MNLKIKEMKQLNILNMCGLYKCRVVFIIGCIIPLISFSQPTSRDYWFSINNGYAKCTKIGETGGQATWYKDNYSVGQFIHKEGEMYAFINYSASTSVDSNGLPLSTFNTEPCGTGLFRHDMVEDKWYRVANGLGSAYYTVQLYTNGTDIVALANYGNVYILDAAQPSGWRLLTSLALRENSFFRVTKKTFTNAVDWRSIPSSYNSSQVIEFMGDTLFFLIKHSNPTAQQIAEQGVIKYNYKTGSVSFDSIGQFPGQWLSASYTCGTGSSLCYDGDHFDSYTFADHIAGRYYLFAHYRDALDRDSCWNLTSKHGEYNTVRTLWTWDPIKKLWFNMSQGPDWRNMTPSGCTGDAGLYKSWDKKKFFLSLQQGIYEWRGDSWQFQVVGGSYNTGPVIPVYDPEDPLDNITFYILNRSGVEMIDHANRVNLGVNKDIFTWCIHNGIREFGTPDNGKTLYVSLNGMKYANRCTWSGNSAADLGIYWLQPDPDKVATTINLHLETGTYIGASGAGNNMAIGTAVAGRHHVFTAGSFNSPLAGNYKLGWTTHNYNGATDTSRAKVIQMNMYGDTMYSVTNLGTKMYDFDAQNFGEYRMVASGDWGVSVLDSSGKNLKYTISNSTAPLNTYGTATSDMRVDIDDWGHVAVLKSQTAFTTPGNTLGFATFFVFDQDGNQVGNSKFIGSPEFTSYGGFFSNWHIQDIAINKDTVYITGFTQDDMDGVYADASCSGGGLPVQSVFLFAYAWNGTAWTKIWRTWGFDGDSLGRDVADSRGYNINMGKDNKLYFLGWMQGTETVYRWDGKDCQCCNGNSDQPSLKRTQKQFDYYNSPYNGGLGSQAYFCTIDRTSGKVERGMMIIPRQSNGKSNTFASARGSIHADQKGFVYVGGSSTYTIMGRDMIHLNGKLLGNYAGGDPSIHIVNPEYTARTYWGAFNKDNSANGIVCGVGIRDNIISALVSTANGTLFTGASRYDKNVQKTVWKESYGMNKTPFRSTGGIEDTWLGMWYQDVWVHSQSDTLQPRKYVSQPIMREDCFKNRVDFVADKTNVCVGESLVVTDYSIGDSCCHTWNFGVDASLLSGTVGEGPWNFSYASAGLKTIIMSMIDSCGNEQKREWYNYINVLPADLAISSLTGSSSLCEGARVFYGTDDVTGIESYIWSVPPGAQIVKGAGTYKIEVIMGNVAGTVSVYGKYACGQTNTLSQAVSIIPALANKVLVVVGEDSPLSPSDTKLRDKITALGYVPWMRDDTDVITDDHQCA